MSDTLYNGLKEMLGEKSVATIITSGGSPERITGHPEFKGIENEAPITVLWIDEQFRRGMWEIALCMDDVNRMCRLCPIYGELFAITLFHALSSGDPDNLQKRICNLSHKFYPEQPGRKYRERYETLMYLMIRKYLKRYFGVDVEAMQEVVDFYNGFFTKPVVGINSRGRMVTYRYSNGSVSEKLTGFFIPEHAKAPPQW